MPSNLFRSNTESGGTDPEDVFLFYHPLTRLTGRRLGNYLGVDHGEERSDANGQYDYVVRWGCRRSAPPTDEVINTNSAIRNASQKLSALQSLQDAGVPVPEFTRHREDVGVDDDSDLQYPVLGRSNSHSQGSDIRLILQDRDLTVQGTSEHYVQYRPKHSEYRVHVVNGQVAVVHEKMQQNDVDIDQHEPHIWNQETGWVFLNPRHEPPSEGIAISAVEELGLDFGAVDIIRTESGDELVLEVNTAPTLDENNLVRWGDEIQEVTDLSAIAGLDSVSWDDDDEDDDEDDDVSV